MSAHREAAGYLPSHVTLLVMGNIRLSELEYALCGRFEVYLDVRENLCLRTVKDGREHRALVQRERQARLEHAQRHAELVKREGDRNKANGYRAPLAGSAEHRAQDDISPLQYRSIDCGNEEPAELVKVRESMEDGE